MSKQNLGFWNGNGQRYLKPAPKVLMLDKMNDVAFEHLKKQTGLDFKESYLGYIAENTTWQKIAKIFLTYDFRSRYFDNWDYKNTLMLKSCHDEEWIDV